MASLGGGLTVNIYGILSVTPATGNYLLVSAINATNSGLAGASSYAFNVYNATNFTITDEVESATAISTDIVAATTLAASEYWLGGFGGVGGANNVWAISDGSANSNWVTDPSLLNRYVVDAGLRHHDQLLRDERRRRRLDGSWRKHEHSRNRGQRLESRRTE